MKQISLLQRCVGWLGAVSLVTAYSLLVLDMVSAKSTLFNSMQLFGGVSLAYRVWLDKNWSNLALNIFFSCVATYAVIVSFI